MSSTGPFSTSGSGAERRRYVRQPITLDATISIQGRRPLPCVVRDFCAAGVFVSLAPEYLHDLTKHTKATLHFSLPVNEVPQFYDLGLVIFRLVGNGIGCGFSDPDPNAVRVLNKFANESNQGVQITDESLAQTQSGFRPDFLRIKDDLLNLCNQRTEALVQDFIRVADEALFLAARDASNNQEETLFLDGQNEFRSLGAEIEGNVPVLAKQAVQIINSPLGGKSSDDSGEEMSELSLIDKDDFEEFLTVSELVSELEPRFKTPLFELEKRFQYLAKREVDEHSNPIGPEVLCNIFAESIKTMESDRQAVNIVYASLKKVLDAGLGRYYDEVNKLFVNNNILRVIEQEKPKFKKTPRSSRPTPPPANLEDTQGGLGATVDLAATVGSGTNPPAGANPSRSTGGSGAAAPALTPLQPGLEPPGSSAGMPSGNAPNQGSQTGQQYPLADSGVAPGTTQTGAGYPASQAPAGGIPVSGGAMPGEIGQVPGAVGSAPGGVGPAPGAVGPVPGAVGSAPGAVGPVPGGVAQAPGVAGQVPGAVGQAPGVGGQSPGQGLPQSAGAPGHAALDVTFGGFAGPPAVYTTPSLQQAYSTAQTQLALRRELSQHSGGAAAPATSGNAYSTQQVVSGLSNVQQSVAGETSPDSLDVGTIKEKIIESIKQAGGGDGHIGQSESDAIEVIANLFRSLISDSYLTTGAKSNLARLQAPVHKVALMDEEFFEATDHPVRQMLNRVALVDDTLDDEGIGQNERLATLIDQVNREFQEDISIFNPVVTELDDILLEQRRRYQENVEAVVQASVEQQKILHDRRSKDPSMSDTQGSKKELPAEWNKWLDRVRAFQVGDRFIMNANTDTPFPVSLVWIGEDGEPFVLVDQKGHKVSTLTMQQIAMYLRRGTLKILDPNEAAAVDRALFGMVNKMHEDVEAQVTQDELTKFSERSAFVQNIDKYLAKKLKKGQSAALCELSIDNLKAINERDGVEAGDNLLEQIATKITETVGSKKAFFGRLSGASLAIFWQRSDALAAQKDIESCMSQFSDIEIASEDGQDGLDVSVGLMAIEDNITPAKDLLSVVTDACETARNNSGKPVHVVGSENKYKEKLEQMVSYVGKAIDRNRLVFLLQRVRALGEPSQLPAAHVVVSAEDRNSKIIPPSLFDQAISKSDRAFEIDTWVIKSSLAWMRDDEKALDSYAAVVIPVSSAAVARDDLADLVMAELMETAVPPGRIVFELKDSDVVSNLTEVTDMMRTLTEFGCRFILDEFGSGQDNYDYLKELPADFVTIQSNFIRDAAENQKDFAMAKSINELAHFMGKRTLAKQERGEEIQDILSELGVDYIFDRSRSSRITEVNG